MEDWRLDTDDEPFGDAWRIPSKKNRKKTQEEEFLVEVLEENPTPRYPTFKPPSSSGFQIAARKVLNIQYSSRNVQCSMVGEVGLWGE